MAWKGHRRPTGEAGSRFGGTYDPTHERSQLTLCTCTPSPKNGEVQEPHRAQPDPRRSTSVKRSQPPDPLSPRSSTESAQERYQEAQVQPIPVTQGCASFASLFLTLTPIADPVVSPARSTPSS